MADESCAERIAQRALEMAEGEFEASIAGNDLPKYEEGKVTLDTQMQVLIEEAGNDIECLEQARSVVMQRFEDGLMSAGLAAAIIDMALRHIASGWDWDDPPEVH